MKILNEEEAIEKWKEWIFSIFSRYFIMIRDILEKNKALELVLI